MTSVKQALYNFQQAFFQRYQSVNGSHPVIQHYSDWPSPCEKQAVAEGVEVAWSPVVCELQLAFDNIEAALEIPLHDDIKSYYGSYFSHNLAARTDDGELELLFAWSLEDFKRLQENILGHILMKRKLRQDVTVFFAVTDKEDIILSLVNDTGEVWAEKVGKKPHRKLADSMSEFLGMLSPVV